MGNYLNTPGIVKFWWKNDIVETKYENIHQIPIITINKEESRIPPTNERLAILHYNDSKKSAEIQAKLKGLKNMKVYAVPNQDSK